VDTGKTGDDEFYINNVTLKDKMIAAQQTQIETLQQTQTETLQQKDKAIAGQQKQIENSPARG